MEAKEKRLKLDTEQRRRKLIMTMGAATVLQHASNYIAAADPEWVCWVPA